MKKLENFIHEHRDEFDAKLPSPELWERIESGIEQPAKKKLSFLKIASSVAAVLVVAILLTFMFTSDRKTLKQYAKISDPEIVQLLETEAYYAREVSAQMDQINRCYEIYPSLKNDIEMDLNELDMMYNALKEDLNDNFYNREVIEAMIQNNRTKLKMVNRVLTQIQC